MSCEEGVYELHIHNISACVQIIQLLCGENEKKKKEATNAVVCVSVCVCVGVCVCALIHVFTCTMQQVTHFEYI